MKNDNLQIRNSTAEFLIFTNQNGKNTIDVRVENENVWLTQKLIAKLFGVDNSTISEHLKNLYKQGEITEKATIGNFPTVQMEGTREVKRTQKFYNLVLAQSVQKLPNNLPKVNLKNTNRYKINYLKAILIE